MQTVFEKGHPRNIPVKLFQNLTSSFREDFLRISSYSYSARSPHSPEPCLWTDQNFDKKFLKEQPKEHSCEIISKSDKWFQRRRLFEELLKKIHFVTMAIRSFDRIKFFGPPKVHSCQVWYKLAQKFGRRRCLKKWLTTHDGHRTTLKAPLQHVVLR